MSEMTQERRDRPPETGKPVTWLRVLVRADLEVHDSVSNFFMERGSTGIVFKDDTLAAFFPPQADGAAVKNDLRLFLRCLEDCFPRSRVGPVRWVRLAEKDWHCAWRRFFRPQRIGRHFLVRPPWIETFDAEKRTEIVIEPAMAFGTGTHETTRSCLELIAEIAAGPGGAPATALDVGTGSAILAIGLVKKGCQKVVAIDNDAAALEAAALNLELNRVADRVKLLDGDAKKTKARFPLVVANIVLGTLVELAPWLRARVQPRGKLILSGLLHTQVAKILDHFGGFCLRQRKDRKDWSTLLLEKKK